MKKVEDHLDTKMVRESGIPAQGSVQSGADAIVHCALSPELEGTTGNFYNVTRATRAESLAYDQAFRKKLWDLSEDLTGEK